MRKVCFVLISSVIAFVPAKAALNVPLTIQETLYPGDLTGHTYSTPGGIARTNSPWCTGVPIADSAGITSTSGLSLASSTAGQFRITETWPDGNAKWIQVCGIIPNVPAGNSVSDTLTSSGAGNFGGQNLASGTNPIVVSTTGGTCGSGSAICFYIKSTNHNGIDKVTIGSTTVVASGSSDGFVVTGPANPGTTCSAGSCTTQYKSSNSSASSCAIDANQNGPVMAVVKCMGDLADGAGNVYMHYTARYYFYAGQKSVKVVSSLRNADYGASNSLATAFKALQGWEFRTGVNVSNPAYSLSTATAGSPQTGSLSSTDSVYLYQGQSSFLQDKNWSNCNDPCTAWTTDAGWRIAKNGSTLTSGTNAQPTEGWANLDAGGVGVNFGTLLFAANGPKSLKFTAGGTVATIGLFALENSSPVSMPWPQYRTDEFYLEFHSTALASPKSDFLTLQQPLIARAPISQYNSAGVFFYPLENPTEEDAFYYSVVTSGTPSIITANGCASYGNLGCIKDVGTQDTATWPLFAYPGGYTYNEGGGRDQIEWRYSYLTNWLTRGHTGRYLQVKLFEMMQADLAYPRSDGFFWNSYPSAVNGFGQPTEITSANHNQSLVSWPDQEHIHTWGIEEYYALSGDETIRDSIMNGMLDWFLSNNTYQAGADGGPANGLVNVSGTAVTLVANSGSSFASYMAGQPIVIAGTVYNVATVNSSSSLTLTTSGGTQTRATWTVLGGVANTRSVGLELSNAARMSVFLNATGDSAHAATALQQGINDYLTQVKPSLCTSNTPAGCTFGTVNGGPWTNQGTSYTRGIDSQFYNGIGIPYCGGGNYRAEGIFQASILDQGLWELRTVAGPSWSDYMTAFDIAAGKVQWAMTEGANYDGTSSWTNNGFRYYILLDEPNGACGDTTYYPVRPNQTVWFPFMIANQYWGGTYSPSMANWQPFLKQTMQHMMSPLAAGVGLTAESIDIGGYQLGALIYAINHGSSNTLQTVPVTNFVINGGGSYTLTWTVPAGAQSYRVKWSPKRIVDWIGFDPVNNVFTGDPVNTVNWFAATEVTSTPAPGTPGTAQSLTISTGTAGLTAANFTVKAYSSAGTGTTSTATASALVMVGGSGQTGTSGTALANAFTVEAVDGSGNPASGVPVTFSVTAGSGTLTNTATTTNSQGLASTTLTLGPSAGANTVTAVSGTLAGSPITFTATATAASTTASSLVLVSGNSQSGNAGQALANPFTVKANDTHGNPVSGVTVIFAITAGGGGLSATAVTTNAQGQASATLTLGTAGGTNTVTATSGTLSGSPITFTATGTATSTAPANLVLVSGNGQTGNPGQALASPLTVEVTSSSGNPVAGVAVIFAVTSGGGSLSATIVPTNSSGQASTTLTLGSAGGANTVTASSPPLSGSPIVFTATGAASSGGSTSVAWTKATQTAGWPTSNGFMSMNWDPVSRKTIIFGHRGFSGTVSVTRGSNAVAWVSGDKFGDFWQENDRISIGGNTYNVLAPPTSPAAPPATNNKTRLTLTTNYSGATGTFAYTAAETAIYSNDVIFYDAGSSTWSWGPGTGAQDDLCIIDTPTMPAQRHPIGQMTVDTRRGLLWLTGGVNQSCTIQPVVTNGSTTVTTTTGLFVMGTNWNGVRACIGAGAATCAQYTVDHVVDLNTVVMTTPVPSGQVFFRLLPPENKSTLIPNSKYDTYYLTLNADPTTDTWTQVPTALHVPDAIIESAMRYDPDDDVIVLFGYDQGADTHDNWVYCSTIGNPGGTLTSNQVTAGCALPNDWTEVSTTCVGTSCLRNHPPGSTYTGIVWDTATHRILQYGGTQGYLGTAQNVVFAYNVETHTWTQKTTINTPPLIIWNSNCCLQSAPTIAYNSLTQKLFYHHLNNNTSADYMYDPVADTWTLLGSPSTGLGATATNGASGQMATFDAANNMIIGWNEGGTGDVWRGVISGSVGSTAPAVVSACDLNGDGVVNVADVQIAVNQALGTSACASGDLNRDGVCNIVDVQTVINASLGGVCVAGH